MAKVILHVDDSASIRNMVSSVISAAGYDVVEAVDGLDGLEKARTRSFNLVLTDQNMPRMDGFGLVTSLRAMPSYERTPILILTTETGADMKAKGKAARATGWLTKPFDPETLIDVIQRLVG